MLFVMNDYVCVYSYLLYSGLKRDLDLNETIYLIKQRLYCICTVIIYTVVFTAAALSPGTL